MTKLPIYICGFSGDGGQLWSGGFENWLRRLDLEDWADIDLYQDSGRNWRAPLIKTLALPSTQPIAGVGYSLGAWGAAWWAYYLRQQAPQRKIALIAGIDPAGRVAGFLGGLPNPKDWTIGRNVAKCFCVDVPMTSPVSWLFGGGKYVAAPDGPQIQFLTRAISDHIWIQADAGIQATITSMLKAAYDAQPSQ